MTQIFYTFHRKTTTIIQEVIITQYKRTISKKMMCDASNSNS